MKIKWIVLFSIVISMISFVFAEGIKSSEDRINDLAFDLYRQLPEPNQNIIFSPYSLSTLLSKLALGSEGQTRDQFNVLFQSKNNNDVQNINTTFNKMDSSLHSRSSCDGWFSCLLMKFRGNFSASTSSRFESADALWADTKFNYKKAFLNQFNDSYVSFKTVNFFQSPEHARLTINDWVEQKTNREIKNLFSQNTISSSTAMVIVNAVYFNGKWSVPFEPKDTKHNENFIVSDDTQAQVDMMFQQKKYPYFETDKLQIVQMDYKDSPLSLAIILPKPGHSLDEIRKSLSAQYFNQLINQSSLQDIYLYLPKFNIESDFPQLQNALIPLGLKDVFQGNANFSLMTDYPLQISMIIQKAVIRVDEQGTVAAAATGGTIMYGSAADYPIFQANHPFIYIIFDKPSKIIMFIGQLTTPGKVENCGNHCQKVQVERIGHVEGITPFSK